MSELKARHIVDVYDSYYAENPFGERSQVYLKSEADKVIALLKDKANYNEYAYKHKSEELADTCRFYEKELRRHKYKRCLAMRNMCRYAQYSYSYLMENESCKIRPNNIDFRRYNKKYHFYIRWRKRWMELAEKFEGAK